MKNVLITGGNGFIGKHLSNLLKECNITLLSRKPSVDGYVTILKDIKNVTKYDLEGIDEVYHLASTVDNYNILSEPYLDVETNIIGTIALLEAAKESKIKIVYVSTFFAHGNSDNLPANIMGHPKPLGTYGATKLCAEHICKVYSSVFSMDIRIARLTNVYGSGDQYLNNKKSAFVRMIYLALTNQPIKLYDNGKNIRDYIHVIDVCNALKLIMENGTPNESYYVGVGKGTSFREMVNIILELLGGHVEVIAPPTFHKQVGIDDFWCDNNGIKQIGWKQTISLRDGILETANKIKEDLNI